MKSSILIKAKPQTLFKMILVIALLAGLNACRESTEPPPPGTVDSQAEEKENQAKLEPAQKTSGQSSSQAQAKVKKEVTGNPTPTGNNTTGEATTVAEKPADAQEDGQEPVLAAKKKAGLKNPEEKKDAKKKDKKEESTPAESTTSGEDEMEIPVQKTDTLKKSKLKY